MGQRVTFAVSTTNGSTRVEQVSNHPKVMPLVETPLKKKKYTASETPSQSNVRSGNVNRSTSTPPPSHPGTDAPSSVLGSTANWDPFGGTTSGDSTLSNPSKSTNYNATFPVVWVPPAPNPAISKVGEPPASRIDVEERTSHSADTSVVSSVFLTPLVEKDHVDCQDAVVDALANLGRTEPPPKPSVEREAPGNPESKGSPFNGTEHSRVVTPVAPSVPPKLTVNTDAPEALSMEEDEFSDAASSPRRQARVNPISIAVDKLKTVLSRQIRNKKLAVDTHLAENDPRTPRALSVIHQVQENQESAEPTEARDLLPSSDRKLTGAILSSPKYQGAPNTEENERPDHLSSYLRKEKMSESSVASSHESNSYTTGTDRSSFVALRPVIRLNISKSVSASSSSSSNSAAETSCHSHDDDSSTSSSASSTSQTSGMLSGSGFMSGMMSGMSDSQQTGTLVSGSEFFGSAMGDSEFDDLPESPSECQPSQYSYIQSRNVEILASPRFSAVQQKLNGKSTLVAHTMPRASPRLPPITLHNPKWKRWGRRRESGEVTTPSPQKQKQSS
jgi:hypothetical protein